MAGTDFSHLTNDELINGIQALKLPEYIRSKGHGVDVRETLAQMTEMTIQLGINMGLSPDDALEWARKIQDIDAQLAQKANISYVDTLMGDITDGSPKEIFYSIEDLEAKYPNGAVGPMLVKDESFIDGAHSFIWQDGIWRVYGSRLSWRLGGLDTTIGKPIPNNKNRIRSLDYVYLDKGTIGLENYSNHKIMVFRFAGQSDSTFVSATEWMTEDFIVSESGYYRVNLAYQDNRAIPDTEVNAVGSLLRMSEVGLGWRDIGVYQATGISNKSIGLEKLNESSLYAVLPNVKVGSEMDWIIGMFVTTTGQPANSTTRIRSLEYTHVSKGNVVNLKNYNNHKFMVFKYSSPADSTFISATPWLSKDYIIEEPCYIKILMAFSDDRDISEADKEAMPNLLKIMTNKAGSENILDKSIKLNHLSDEVRNRLSKEGGYYFRGPIVPAIPVGSNALGYNDFMEQTWEDLRAKHPNYIEREVVTRDTSDTFDIYEYTFTPEHYERTVFLVAGIHGDEYEGYWGLYYFMKYVTEDSHNHERLRDLKYNTRFVVIPILNPWGVENRTRATSRVSNANNNYDVFHRAPEYESPAGSYAFSENEALSVKLVADKYNAEFDFFADFHTDRYDPQNGNYMIVNQLSSALKIGKELTYDEAYYLKEDYGFDTVFKPKIVNINQRSSSFKYMEAVRGVPSALLEVGTGRLSPIGSSLTMTVGVDWFTNIITEMLKQDLTQPKQPKNALEQSILENRLSGYSHSVARKIPDEYLQVFLDRSGFAETEWENKAERASVDITGFDSNSNTTNGIVFNDNVVTVSNSLFRNFTLLFKATITDKGRLVGSNGDLNLIIENASEHGRYNISNGSGLLYCSALKYNEEVSIGIKSENNTLSLYVNGEPFNSVSANHSLVEELYIGASSGGVKMNLDSLVLYNRPLKNEEIGFVFKSFISE